MSGQWLIDPSAGAGASRPARGMPLPSGWSLPLDAAERGCLLSGGAVVVYRLFPGEKSYTGSPDWRWPSRQKPAVRELIHTVEKIRRQTR